MELKLLELKKPMSLKWRVQRAIPNRENPTHVIMVAYTDARDIQDRLDEVVGMGAWQTKYYECKGKQFCEIGIKVGSEWIWKGDNGTESQTEKQKGETSDAFKRAAVHWGINRYAYKVGEVKLPCRLHANKPYPVDESGKFLKGKALAEACNSIAKVEEFDIEFDNMYMDKSSEFITLEDVMELYELKKPSITADLKKDIERIIKNNETDKFKSITNKLKSL